MRMFLLTALTVFSMEALAGGLKLIDSKVSGQESIQSISIKYNLSDKLSVITLTSVSDPDACKIFSSNDPTSSLALYNTLNAALLNQTATTIIVCENNKIAIQSLSFRSMIDPIKAK